MVALQLLTVLFYLFVTFKVFMQVLFCGFIWFVC